MAANVYSFRPACHLVTVGLLALAAAASAARPSPGGESVPSQAGLFRVRELHGDLVRDIAYSPTGDRIITAGFDKLVHVSEASTGRIVATLDGHADKVAWVSATDDGRTLATGSFDRTVRLWDAATGQLRRTLTGHRGAAWAGAITPDGRTVVSGGPERELIFWDAETGKPRTIISHPCAVHWIDVSRTGELVAVADADGRISLYDGRTEKLLQKFGNHVGGIYGVACSPDGTHVATAGADATIKVWDAATGGNVYSWTHFGAVYGVAFSADGRYVASCGADFAVRVFDVQTGALARHLTGPRDALWCVAFSPDGATLATAGNDGKLYLADWQSMPKLPTGKLPARVDLRPKLSRWKLNVVPQGGRNTCSVQTFTRGMEFALSHKLQRGEPLSDEYFNWACNQVIGNTGPGAVDRGQFFEHLWMGYCRHGFCGAREMPFTSTFDPNAAPSDEARRTAARFEDPSFVFENISGPGRSDAEVVQRVKAIVAAGWPVLAGSAHSLLVVGYVDDRRNPGGGRFIVADSGAGGFIDRDTGDKLHSAITYARAGEYGFVWVYVRDDLPAAQ